MSRPSLRKDPLENVNRLIFVMLKGHIDITNFRVASIFKTYLAYSYFRPLAKKDSNRTSSAKS